MMLTYGLCHIGWYPAYPWHIYGELRLADWKRDLQGESLLQTGKVWNVPFLCIDSFVTTSMSNYMNTEQAFFKKKNPKVLLDKKHQGKFSLLRCPCILVCEYKMLQNATFKKKSFLKVFFSLQVAADGSYEFRFLSADQAWNFTWWNPVLHFGQSCYRDRDKARTYI